MPDHLAKIETDYGSGIEALSTYLNGDGVSFAPYDKPNLEICKEEGVIPKTGPLLKSTKAALPDIVR